jgi:hypothetical protein
MHVWPERCLWVMSLHKKVVTSKEVTVLQEGAREAAEAHTLTVREEAQEGEAGDVSSAAK